jgi:hypothetical protein
MKCRSAGGRLQMVAVRKKLDLVWVWFYKEVAPTARKPELMKLYKYLASKYFEKVFRNDLPVCIKANCPENFNDPYELFLTIDTNDVRPEILAYYQEIVGQVPQLPTVCFSARPDVVPMWAHYAKECSGIVIEFDGSALLKALPKAKIKEVKYSETPTTIDADQLAYAFGTTKPRHTFFIQNTAFNSAYFTKSKYWSYELEYRLVANTEDITIQNELMFLQLPLDCVSAIIAGPKIDQKVASTIDAFCKQADYSFYQMHIGRSSMRSFFTNQEKHSFIFDGGNLVQAESYCVDCGEPLEVGREKCHWCAVNEDDKAEAAF